MWRIIPLMCAMASIIGCRSEPKATDAQASELLLSISTFKLRNSLVVPLLVEVMDPATKKVEVATLQPGEEARIRIPSDNFCLTPRFNSPITLRNIHFFANGEVRARVAMKQLRDGTFVPIE
jgi:hypothetical protein